NPYSYLSFLIISVKPAGASEIHPASLTSTQSRADEPPELGHPCAGKRVHPGGSIRRVCGRRRTHGKPLVVPSARGRRRRGRTPGVPGLMGGDPPPRHGRTGGSSATFAGAILLSSFRRQTESISDPAPIIVQHENKA